jgi:hypothetical protein
MAMRMLIVVAILLVVASCAYKPGTANSQYFSTKNGPVEFQFPAGWYQNPKDHPYDLQCFSKDDSLTTGVFLFTKADLADSAHPGQILQSQIDDLRAKRENFKILEDIITVPLQDKTITTVVYSGEKDSLKYNYRFTLIEFTYKPDYLPVVVQVARPSQWTSDKAILEEITRSARVRTEKL